MNWIKVQRFFTKPVDEIKMTNALNNRFKLRNVKETVHKYEDFRLRMHEAKRIGNKDDHFRYQSYLEVLEWILHADKNHK